MKKHTLIFPVLLIIGVFIFQRCANPVMPVGGPKDVAPPIVTETEPVNYSLFFEEDQFRIYFNEFVSLKDVDKQLIVSPPLMERPELKIRGRSVLFKFDRDEELKADATYSIFFGNAIQDLTEGNPLGNFIYVFSTGEHLDSLSIIGKVNMAFDMAPAEETFVMLYTDNNDTIPFDSLPYKVRPDYVSKTDEHGHFGLYNLAGKEFKLFAIKDVNSNYIYDMPNEEIAFLDKIIHPDFVPLHEHEEDSIVTDSLLLMDSLMEEVEEHLHHEELHLPHAIADSLFGDTSLYAGQFYQLYLFEGIDTVQKPADQSLISPGHYQIIMRYPTKELRLEELPKNDTMDWLTIQMNKGKDTIDLWYPILPSDSATFLLFNMDTIVDTLEIALKEPEKKTKKRKKKEEEEEEEKRPSLQVSNSTSTGFNFYQNFYIDFGAPIGNIEEQAFFLRENEDTLAPPAWRFTDSLVHRQILVEHEWKAESDYTLIVPDSMFWDIFGYSHDSLLINFKTKALSEYGTLKLKFSYQDEDPLIIEMYTENDKLVRRDKITESVNFDYGLLKPGSYKFKCIIDRNKNGQWDTGNYGKKLQPERVVWYDKLLEIRANWDIEDEWEIKP